jgi:hypothetical protein
MAIGIAEFVEEEDLPCRWIIDAGYSEEATGRHAADL